MAQLPVMRSATGDGNDLPLLYCLRLRFYPVLPGPSLSSSSVAVDDIYLHFVHHVAFDIPIYSVAFLPYM
ncbi:hypothetical protein N7465_011434 [Penicillium sp. CMV-2018d]|nr:hypothetical protein N7465_011434 [Penicillium sp. CMV-2018d]